MSNSDIEKDLGFIVSEDQSDTPAPDPDEWQKEFNACMRRAWLQGFAIRDRYYDTKIEDNPYLARDNTDDLVVATSALGWEDGFVAAERGLSVHDCPYPEG